tara:strand:- start:246 stop:1508 length:1263 start_codon:yes stop_codon:yes gene_type:complete
MTSKIIVNNIESDSGISSITFNDDILVGDINSTGTSTFNVISGVSTIGVTTVHLTGINNLNYPNVGSLSNRNIVINGGMTVAQRSTSTSTILGSPAYRTIDRFRIELSGYTTAEGTLSQSSESPVGFSSSLRVNVTTAESIAAADLATIRYRVEAQDCQQFAYGTSQAKTLTLSFWVRSSLTGTYAVSLYQVDDGRNLGLTYNIDTADTWEHKSLNIPPDTTGVIDDDNEEGFQIAWNLSAGSNFKGTDNTTWGAYSNARWANGHTADLFGSTSNFYLTGVQLETGSIATPFEHRRYSDELARCQRYCYAAVADGSIDNYAPLANGRYYSATNAQFNIFFPVTMRYPPTLDSSTTAAGTFFYNTDGGFGGVEATQIVLNERSYNNATVTTSGATGQTAGDGTTLYCHDAEFAKLIFTAEL